MDNVPIFRKLLKASRELIPRQAVLKSILTRLWLPKIAKEDRYEVQT